MATINIAARVSQVVQEFGDRLKRADQSRNNGDAGYNDGQVDLVERGLANQPDLLHWKTEFILDATVPSGWIEPAKAVLSSELTKFATQLDEDQDGQLEQSQLKRLSPGLSVESDLLMGTYWED